MEVQERSRATVEHAPLLFDEPVDLTKLIEKGPQFVEGGIRRMAHDASIPPSMGPRHPRRHREAFCTGTSRAVVVGGLPRNPQVAVSLHLCASTSNDGDASEHETHQDDVRDGEPERPGRWVDRRCQYNDRNRDHRASHPDLQLEINRAVKPLLIGGTHEGILPGRGGEGDRERHSRARCTTLAEVQPEDRLDA